MIRLFTLATISSTIAARAGTIQATSAASSSPVTAGRGSGAGITDRRDAGGRARWGGAGGSVPVLAGVFEGEDGAVDMDLRVFLEVGDVALERLFPLLAEQLQLDAVPDLVEIGVLRFHLAHQLEDQIGPGVLQNLAYLPRLEPEERLPQLDRQLLLRVGPGLALVRGDRLLPGERLESRGIPGELSRQPVGQTPIIDQDLAKDNRARDTRGLGLLFQVVLDLAGRDLHLAEDRLVLHLLDDDALAHLLPEGLLALAARDLGLALRHADLGQVVVDLRLGDRDRQPLRLSQQELLLDHLVEEAALDGVRLPRVLVLGVTGVVGQVRVERLDRDRVAAHRGDH